MQVTWKRGPQCELHRRSNRLRSCHHVGITVYWRVRSDSLRRSQWSGARLPNSSPGKKFDILDEAPMLRKPTYHRVLGAQDDGEGLDRGTVVLERLRFPAAVCV